MSERPFRVLFLCTGNSARSVMAEAALNALGAGRFEAYSAGSRPAGRLNPYTLEVLARHGHRVEHLRSKSWDEFARADAPCIDLVVTVCDNAAGEACPVWPGRPARAHWSFEDPAAYTGPDAGTREKFESIYRQIRARVARLAALPVETLEPAVLRERLQALESAA